MIYSSVPIINFVEVNADWEPWMWDVKEDVIFKS